MRNAVIRSTGAYVPKKILPNSYFDETLGEDVSTWLSNNLKIKERRWCADDESTIDLCLHAAQQALDRAQIKAKELDLIIVATDTPEYLTPSTASVLQYKLQAGHAGTFDLNAACAGFITGLDVASKYIRTDERYNNIMVVGAYCISKFLDKSNKKTVTLFADGAGAIILGSEQTENRGYLGSELMTLGQYYDGMGIYGGGTKHPTTLQNIHSGEDKLKINYRFPPELNPQVWTTLSRNLSKRFDFEVQEVKHYILTQININSIHQTLNNLKVPLKRAHTSMEYYAYTGSACIPITFNSAIEQNKVQKDDLILMIGSGSGLSFGSIAFRF